MWLLLQLKQSLNMNIKDLFKKRIAEVKAKGYTPKFKPGDIILNKKFIIVRKVIKVIEKRDAYNQEAEYVLKDIHNPLKTKQSVKAYEVFKVCAKIDDYYDKINEQSAKILYGYKE